MAGIPSRRQFLARSAQGAAGAACAGLAWFALLRQEVNGRTQRYTVRAYAADKAEGERYGA